MELKINLPFSMWDYKISGVYKILFEDGSFYIGCSNHIRSRASNWESIMATGKGVAGKDIGTNVINKIRELSFATLDIIELCHPKDLKDKESFYLDKNADNPQMVSSNDIGAWKSVLQYKTDGIFIKKHFSTKGAARYNGFRLSAVQKVLYGERKSYKGMVFVYEKDYHQRRRDIVKKRSKRIVERKAGRNVLMINEKGEVVKEFKKIIDAAKEAGCRSQNIRRALSGFQKTAKGFVFKYA